MRVRSTILAAALTVSALALGAGSAVADDDRYAPHDGLGYHHKGFAGTYDSVGGPLGIVWAQAAGYSHEGMGHEPGAQR
ncbi:MULTISPECIES: hypothetical protein [Streptomyces]|uniref:Uncharacterized protein n=1 Tax=Streptomyces venezuelae TaxID=54571 RepID=A0A5P2B4Z6_STRVZ|nr:MULTISPECIES: hypothetical protein [Streptomyces]NEA02691.1 hypothetical protein [Streptomyces sp. SID10116]MYY83036.1 hypothetical protein [Streptomyces sp. SID335]MYZ17599.1 hypothetical protein [Streptomyces sp. SID337]NDZ87361.1 hypothetical protein [Streptomyces sp. SID10115]NEB46389.1 hypothetical protein [Streptomyces sp. SID339]